MGITLALENHGPTFAPNYAFEWQLVPLEDELLLKDHAFRSKLEYVPFSLLSLCVDPILGGVVESLQIRTSDLKYRDEIEHLLRVHEK